MKMPTRRQTLLTPLALAFAPAPGLHPEVLLPHRGSVSVEFILELLNIDPDSVKDWIAGNAVFSSPKA